MKSTYETMGGKYQQKGDYLLPNLEVPECPKVGVWGERRRKYLRDHQKALYTAMMLSDTLNAHLEEVDRAATEMYDRLTLQLAEQESDPPEIGEGFKELENFLCTLPLDDNNAVFNLCCRLCVAYEHKAFLDGLQYGAHLTKELFSK